MRVTNLDIGSAPLEWSRVIDDALEATPDHRTYWLATTSPDGRPHVAGVGALWIEDTLYFVSGPRTRKSRNLATNPHCAVSVALPGLDLVIEGTAATVSDAPTVARVTERYAAQGWPATATGTRITAPYSAPSAGPPPWHLDEVMSVVGVASEEPLVGGASDAFAARVRPTRPPVSLWKPWTCPVAAATAPRRSWTRVRSGDAAQSC